MIYVLMDKDKRITGAVDTRRIIGFVFDGTSPEYDPRYILKLDYGYDLQVGAVDMQNILSAMEKEGERYALNRCGCADSTDGSRC